MKDALFVFEGGRYTPTEHAASSWSAALVHGGAIGGLLMHAIERVAVTEEMFVARLTLDIFRPVPIEPLEVTAHSVRRGRRIHVVEADLLARLGSLLTQARALVLRQSEAGEAVVFDRRPTPAGPEGLRTLRTADGRNSASPIYGFHQVPEIRWVAAPSGVTRTQAWMRMPLPLIAGEPLSPLVRVALTADFVNGLARRTRTSIGYINADTTLYLHRLPEEEWICVESARTIGSAGLGVAEAILYDTAGTLGSVTQAVLANG